MTGPWQCDDLRARLSIDSCTGELDIKRPVRGLHSLNVGGRDLLTRLFQFDPDSDAARLDTLIDSYIRGDDLVLTYAETEDRPLRRQAYWRAFRESSPVGPFVGVDLIVSTQTDLLSSDSTLRLRSVFGGELQKFDERVAETHATSYSELQLGDLCEGSLLLHRPDQDDHSLAICVQPADFSQVEIATGTETELTYTLFRPGLEKGVIRRARLRAAFMRRDNDWATALAAYQSLADSALPLTT